MSILSVTQAETAINVQVPLLTPTSVGLRHLQGSVLAEAIYMERDQPPFNRVTMDGIAINSRTSLRDFRIIGTQAAGSPPLSILQTDECIEVMTGAELPTGCDCVIPVEQIKRSDNRVELLNSAAMHPNLNVQLRGSDATQGQLILQPGTRLSATEIAIIASAGYRQAVVRPSPRIALVSTGNELIEPGEAIKDWQIRRSNTYAIQAALQQHGHRHVVDHHLVDDMTSMRNALNPILADNDVVILSGGVSMGKFDYVPQVLTDLGVQCIFHKVAQRPGKPLWFGLRSDGKTVYALPGNPVSTLICLHRYVLPGLLHSMGANASNSELIRLAHQVKTNADMTLFLPVTLCRQNDTVQAITHPTRGSGDFISLLGTQGFVQLPQTAIPLEAGTEVPFYRWQS